MSRGILMKALALAALAFALPACGGSSASSTSGMNSPTGVTFNDPGIQTFPDEGHTHVPIGTVIVYHTDPPTSGNHYPVPQGGGFFTTPILPGFLVHSMEHGGVIIYYTPAVPQSELTALQALANAHPGIFGQVVVVPRNDPADPIILTAWTHMLRLAVFDINRIDNFLSLFLGKGPEAVPASPWGDPLTTNSTATPFFNPNAELRVTDTSRPGSMMTDSGVIVSAQPATISADMEVSTQSLLGDTASFQIVDASSSAVVAQAVYDSSTGTITFSIGKTTFPPIFVVTGAFHTVTFRVDPGHNATWSTEGTSVGPVGGFASASVTLSFVATFVPGAGVAPDILFGNPVATSP